MKPFPVAVSGSRELAAPDIVRAFEVLLYRAGIVNLRLVEWHHGACPWGVDAAVDAYLRERHIVPVQHEARAFGPWPGAGPKRNAHMISRVQMLLAIWDGVSPGTRGAIQLAAARKMPVLVEIVYA